MVYETQSNEIYKVTTFACTESTSKQFSEQLETVINQTAAEGWRLHSFKVIHGDICVVVFYKAKN